MEAKLIKNRLFLRKVVDSYVLHRIKDGILTIEGDSQYTIGGIEPFYKLSLKNCQAIERGYDLDELSRNYGNKDADITNDFGKGHREGCYMGYLAGFQKALEILGNKKFSEDDIRKAILLSMKYNDNAVIKSLQQTEWDVEICNIMDCIDGNPCNGTSFECNHCTNIGEPKLDADGCLILKRI